MLLVESEEAGEEPGGLARPGEASPYLIAPPSQTWMETAPPAAAKIKTTRPPPGLDPGTQLYRERQEARGLRGPSGHNIDGY